MSVRYELVDGSLPLGVKIRQNGYLQGIIDPSNMVPTPEWVTSEGNLANLLVGDTVPEEDPIVVEATPFDEESTIRYSLIDGDEAFKGLPWGLWLDSKTGEITGVIESFYGADAPSWLPEEVPTWISESGSLGTFDALGEVDITLEAEPASMERELHYVFVGGNLPWGVAVDTVDGTCVLSGSPIQQPQTEPLYFNPEPRPTWNVPSGSRGSFDELETVNLTFNATPNLGATVRYEHVGGMLPFGLWLDPETGQLSGNLNEILFHSPEEPKLPKPTWITSSANLGTHTVGGAVSVQVEAESQLGGTLKYFVVSGGLPWGLSLDSNTGEIEGNVESFVTPSTYTITIEALDDQQAYSRKQFHITITAPEEP